MTIDYSGMKILVVDDEPDSIEVVELLFNANGAVIMRALDGYEALALFKEYSPDLVLTDLSMPEMNGWDLLKEIRQCQSQHVPVIAITAHAMSGDREKVLEAGFDGYISKPLQMYTLLNDVEGCLKRKT